MRFLAGMVYIGALLPLYLQWSRGEAERQIDRMQTAVFNSPGAEAPITPAVVIGGITLVTSHMVIARRILHLTLPQALLSLIFGGCVGFVGWRQFYTEG